MIQRWFLPACAPSSSGEIGAERKTEGCLSASGPLCCSLTCPGRGEVFYDLGLTTAQLPAGRSWTPWPPTRDLSRAPGTTPGVAGRDGASPIVLSDWIVPAGSTVLVLALPPSKERADDSPPCIASRLLMCLFPSAVTNAWPAPPSPPSFGASDRRKSLDYAAAFKVSNRLRTNASTMISSAVRCNAD
jgi:hypothetical protein